MNKEERLKAEREHRKDLIADCAERVFFEKGFAAATIDRIAAEAGYTKRTIYFYFRDKEELFLAVVYRAQKMFYAYLERGFHQGLGEREGASSLMRIGRNFYAYAADHPEYVSMLMYYESNYHRYHEGVSERFDQRALCQNISINYGDLVKRAIEEDTRNGLIQSELSADQLLLLLWGQGFGVMQVLLMRSDDFDRVYGISREDLYEHFMSAVRSFLKAL